MQSDNYIIISTVWPILDISQITTSPRITWYKGHKIPGHVKTLVVLLRLTVITTLYIEEFSFTFITHEKWKMLKNIQQSFVI